MNRTPPTETTITTELRRVVCRCYCCSHRRLRVTPASTAAARERNLRGGLDFSFQRQRHRRRPANHDSGHCRLRSATFTGPVDSAHDDAYVLVGLLFIHFHLFIFFCTRALCTIQCSPFSRIRGFVIVPRPARPAPYYALRNAHCNNTTHRYRWHVLYSAHVTVRPCVRNARIVHVCGVAIFQRKQSISCGHYSYRGVPT